MASPVFVICYLDQFEPHINQRLCDVSSGLVDRQMRVVDGPVCLWRAAIIGGEQKS